MSKIDLAAAPRRSGTGYPPPYDEPCKLRERLRLGKAAELTQFGVNLLQLPPGQWSSQRHWHAREDEFVWVVEGEVVLADDSGERVLRAGDCAGFPASERNGHHLKNRSDRTAVLLEVGTRDPNGDAVDYPDIDLTIPEGESGFFHKDGRPY